MTPHQTEHRIRIRKPASVPARATPIPVAAPDQQTRSSASMIEACDRLGQKLDQVAGLIREQTEVWRQNRPPIASHAGTRENAVQPAVAAPKRERAFPKEETPASSAIPAKSESNRPPAVVAARLPLEPSDSPPPPELEGPATKSPPLQNAVPPPTSPENAASAALSESARQIFDTMSRSAGGWPEQAAGMQQVLDAIMTHLENQAATATPRVDVTGITSRLKDLEEQQRDLQSQLNNHRWGP